MPFDGRSRTAPIYPLTALLLVGSGQPVVLQGGRRMPVKFGITAAELFASIGLNLSGLSINRERSNRIQPAWSCPYLSTGTLPPRRGSAARSG